MWKNKQSNVPRQLQVLFWPRDHPVQLFLTCTSLEHNITVTNMLSILVWYAQHIGHSWWKKMKNSVLVWMFVEILRIGPGVTGSNYQFWTRAAVLHLLHVLTTSTKRQYTTPWNHDRNNRFSVVKFFIKFWAQGVIENRTLYNAEIMPDTFALLPLVKRQVFCVWDRFKLLGWRWTSIRADDDKAWATTITI